jgi:hypothetical protein
MVALRRLCVIAFAGLAATACVSVYGGDSTPSRPAYKFLRWQEDWSVQPALAASDSDAFDSIKYVSLDSGGSYWASFGGDFRVRLEDWSNFNFAAPPGVSHDDSFVLTRFRAHGDVHLAEAARAFLEVKGAYASDRNLPGGVRSIDEDKFELQQLFFDIKIDLGLDNPMNLRLGRQQLIFGAQRLVSPLPWANSLRTWDGFQAMQGFGDWDVTAFGTAFVPVDPDGIGNASRDQLFYGVYAKRVIPGTPGGLELYALRNQWEGRAFNGSVGQDRRWTLGLRKWAPFAERADYEIELSYQTGKTGIDDVSAWSFASQLGYKALDNETLRLWAGLDWASGDGSPGGDVGTFNQLYPLGHAYFGIADVIGRQNIVDTSIGATWKAAPKLGVTFAAHSFWVDSTSDAIYNPGGGVVRAGGTFQSSDVGYETDVTAKYGLARHLTIDAGYGHFFAGDAIKESGPSENIDFFYLGATFTM